MCLPVMQVRLRGISIWSDGAQESVNFLTLKSKVEKFGVVQDVLDYNEKQI